MKLSSAFIQLPLLVNSELLKKEVSQFNESDWLDHPQDFKGNSAIPLISHMGAMNNDYEGTMLATPMLRRCPYLRNVLSQMDTVLGRTRLMRLAPNHEVPSHQDTHYSWWKRIRVHIPIVTQPEVLFTSNGEVSVNMQAGEVWIFDNWHIHQVQNNSNIYRIHLVTDTTGSSQFWNMVSKGWKVNSNNDFRTSIEYQNWKTTIQQPELIETPIITETHNRYAVRSPNDVDNILNDFIELLLPLNVEKSESIRITKNAIHQFSQDWRCLWAQYSNSITGIEHYQKLIDRLHSQCINLWNDVLVPQGISTVSSILQKWTHTMTDVEYAKQQAVSGQLNIPFEQLRHIFDRPVFIVAAPRSGSTMLFETLQKNIDFWSLGDESHSEFESIKELGIAAKHYTSNQLEAADLNETIGSKLIKKFLQKMHNIDGVNYLQLPESQRPNRIRFLEKTPKNALRIPFLKALFPSAKFIYLQRAPESNIGSMIDAWQSQRFVTYSELPNWSGSWSLLLPEGWQQQKGKNVVEIAAWQWQSANNRIMDTLEQLPEQDYCIIDYDQLLENREKTLKAICNFSSVPFGPRMQSIIRGNLSLSKYTLTKPGKDKWKRYENTILAAKSIYADTASRMQNF